MSAEPGQPRQTARAHAGQEPHDDAISGRLNWLRAGVLGANDGIVSVAAVLVGVAAATPALAPLLTAGVASLAGGAISMALGEYVSVSSQRDSEQSLIEKERRELADDPEGEFEELVGLYRARGLTEPTAHLVAEELTRRDVLRAHLSEELGITAAAASAVAFLLGGVVPFVAMLLIPAAVRVPVTVVVVLLALALTGAAGARLGRAPALRPTLRVVVGGAIALAVTYGLGVLLGTSGAV
jgi:VIT1/CCC1 family predicted Fe2+/Mn2+ transporter